MEEILDYSTELHNMLEKFQHEFIDPVARKRDKMWDLIKGGFPTKEAQLEYDTINNRVIFLEAMLGQIKKMSNVNAVLTYNIGKLFEEGEKLSVFKGDQLRTTLLKEQAIGLSIRIFKLKEIINEPFKNDTAHSKGF